MITYAEYLVQNNPQQAAMIAREAGLSFNSWEELAYQLHNEMLHSNNPDFFKDYDLLKKNLVDEMWKWEKLHIELESLKNKRK